MPGPQDNLTPEDRDAIRQRLHSASNLLQSLTGEPPGDYGWVWVRNETDQERTRQHIEGQYDFQAPSKDLSSQAETLSESVQDEIAPDTSLSSQQQSEMDYGASRTREDVFGADVYSVLTGLPNPTDIAIESFEPVAQTRLPQARPLAMVPAAESVETIAASTGQERFVDTAIRESFTGPADQVTPPGTGSRLSGSAAPTDDMDPRESGPDQDPADPGESFESFGAGSAGTAASSGTRGEQQGFSPQAPSSPASAPGSDAGVVWPPSRALDTRGVRASRVRMQAQARDGEQIQRIAEQQAPVVAVGADDPQEALPSLVGDAAEAGLGVLAAVVEILSRMTAEIAAQSEKLEYMIDRLDAATEVDDFGEDSRSWLG